MSFAVEVFLDLTPWFSYKRSHYWDPKAIEQVEVFEYRAICRAYVSRIVFRKREKKCEIYFRRFYFSRVNESYNFTDVHWTATRLNEREPPIGTGDNFWKLHLVVGERKFLLMVSTAGSVESLDRELNHILRGRWESYNHFID